MKKLILLIALLVSSFTQAQFRPEQLKSLTQAQANSFANDVATNAKTQWEFVQAKESLNGDYYIVSYSSGEKTFKIVFNVFYEGQNKALEIVGTKTYRFYEVWGSYLDLFPTWKKVFRPDAELEKTVDDFNSQELINRPAKINFKLKGSDDEWHITNWS
ncbi:hypothetical protein [Flavobacterium sp. AED]|uniref:hypothetical protein n=1 Tax=Flavobacterium sp. AED TaxID=1423323 RepID=UPI00057EE909|nr:hypothetical protein [Flavobacterium sp. AED]KIA86596.1 hypothetical protein OA85_02810 [Flavobacterium sp. AED]